MHIIFIYTYVRNLFKSICNLICCKYSVVTSSRCDLIMKQYHPNFRWVSSLLNEVPICRSELKRTSSVKLTIYSKLKQLNYFTRNKHIFHTKHAHETMIKMTILHACNITVTIYDRFGGSEKQWNYDKIRQIKCLYSESLVPPSRYGRSSPRYSL